MKIMNIGETIKFIRKKDYKYLKSIGRGGLGLTILVEDEYIKERFVCKKYLPYDESLQEEYFKNFVEEVRLLHLLFHKNVVRVFNYYMFPEYYTGYILMEYIEGNTINKYIMQNPDKIEDIFTQTIEGFRYLEENKILHRDIRPENILVSKEGVVKIIDFGFGKKIDFPIQFEKSVSINWRFSVPLEFREQKYDFRTEVYFVGKLFEEIIDDNKINIKFTELLKEMIKENPNNRISSFFEVSRLLIEDEIDIEFEDFEREIYNEFVSEIIPSIEYLEREVEYLQDIDLIVTKLKKVYSDNILENIVSDRNQLINCFIRGKYSFKAEYYNSYSYSMNVLKNFYKWFKRQSIERKKIILNHIWKRLDTVSREAPFPKLVNLEPKNEDDDLPF